MGAEGDIRIGGIKHGKSSEWTIAAVLHGRRSHGDRGSGRKPDHL